MMKLYQLIDKYLYQQNKQDKNIYFNASIFGLTAKDIDDRIQDIIDFSEL